MRIGKKIFKNLLLAIGAMIILLPGQVYAAGQIDTSAQTSLTIQFAPEGVSGEGTEFCMYRVADVSETAKFRVTEQFKESGLVIPGDITQEGWQQMAALLQGYISAGPIKPDYTAKITASGTAKFENIPVGLYLIQGEVLNVEHTYYTPQSYMLCLPNLDENDVWQYHVTSAVKYEKEVEERVSLEILKVWKDYNYSGRPKSIEVEVYENAQLYKTITLSETNNWRIQLTELSANSSWSVKEKEVPDGYTVSVEKQTNRIVITNTRPEEPDEPEKELPQTGMLWWPVYVLTATGLLLIVMGYLRRKGNENGN